MPPRPGSDRAPDLEGSCYAHLYENPRADIPRRLYWALELRAPRETRIQVEWLAWPDTWAGDLAGRSLADACAGRAAPEASSYAEAEGEHRPLTIEHLLVREASARHLLVELRFQEPLDEPLEEPLEILPPVLLARCTFSGVVVVPANLAGCPATEPEVRSVLSAHYRVETLAPGVWERFRFLFEPLPA